MHEDPAHLPKLLVDRLHVVDEILAGLGEAARRQCPEHGLATCLDQHEIGERGAPRRRLQRQQCRQQRHRQRCQKNVAVNLQRTDATRRQRHHLTVAVHAPEHQEQSQVERRRQQDDQHTDQLQGEQRCQDVTGQFPGGDVGEVARQPVAQVDEHQDDDHCRHQAVGLGEEMSGQDRAHRCGHGSRWGRWPPAGFPLDLIFTARPGDVLAYAKRSAKKTEQQ